MFKKLKQWLMPTSKSKASKPRAEESVVAQLQAVRELRKRKIPPHSKP